MAKAMDKRQSRILFALVAAMVIIAVIGVCVLRFGFPDEWDSLMSALFSSELSDGELVVHFLDVGQGDGIYIEFPDGTDMLIDMGSTKGFSSEQAVAAISALDTDGKIDRLMLTHSDTDHVSYLDEIIYAFDVANIYMPNILAEPKQTTQSGRALAERIKNLDKAKLAMFDDPDTVDTNAYAEFFIAALSEEGCNLHLNVDKNEHTNSIDISGEDYMLTFWCPTEEDYASGGLGGAEELNAVSPVGILRFNGRRIVFTGDSNELNEPAVAERIGYVDCDVLKVAHHGSRTSPLDVFLDAVDCEYAVISCGADNAYGHPTQAALDRLKARGMTVYRTDLNGDIVLTVDSRGEIEFSTEKYASASAIFKGQDR